MSLRVVLALLLSLLPGLAWAQVAPIAPANLPLFTTTARGAVNPPTTATGKLLTDNNAWVAAINSLPIGNTTPSTGAFTTLAANGAVTFTGSGTGLSVANNATIGGTALGGTFFTGNSGTRSYTTSQANPASGPAAIAGQFGFVDYSNLVGSISSGVVNANSFTYSADTIAAPTGSVTWFNILGNLGRDPWQPSHAYVVNNRYANLGNVYIQTTASCTSAASGGPTGTGSSITDGTCSWNYVSSNFSGSRAGLQVYMNYNSQNGAAANDAARQYQAALFTTQANYTMGGSSPHSGSSAGFFYGTGNQMWCKTGATNLSGCISQEIDIGLWGTASAASRVGTQIISFGTNQGGDNDDGLRFAAVYASGAYAPGFMRVIAVGPGAVDPAGAILGYETNIGSGAGGFPDAAARAAFGIDLAPWKFTTAAFRSAGGFSVDGSGIAHVGAALLGISGTTVKLDVGGSVVTAVAVSNGGGLYYVGDQLYDPATGLIATVTTTTPSPGAITGISLTVAGAVTGATPSNPVVMSGGSGNAASLTVTWTAISTLALQPSAGPTTVGGTLAVTGATSLNGWLFANSGATFAFDVFVGTNTQQRGLNMGGPIASNRPIWWNSAGVNRWTLRANATAEAGSNAGSDLEFISYDDSGTALINPLLRFTRSTGAARFYGPISSDTGTSITLTGAKCDGTTDDTAVINAYLATLTTGGRVTVPPGRMCKINSANLTIPANVIVQGGGSPHLVTTANKGPSGFLLNPTYTVTLGSGATLRDIAVIRTGLTTNPTSAQVIAAVIAWGTETSVGITVAGSPTTLEHVFVEGFNTCVYSYTNRVNLSDVQGDCYNGLFLASIGDNFSISDVRFEPFYTLASTNTGTGNTPLISVAQGAPGTALQFAAGNNLPSTQVGDYAAVLTGARVNAIPYGTTVTAVNNAAGTVTLSAATTSALQVGDVVTFGGSWGRPGVGFHLMGLGGNITGWYCQRCFTFNYRHGLMLTSVGVGYANQSGFEWQSFLDPGTNGEGSLGIRLVGDSSGVVISDSTANGFATNWSMETTGHEAFISRIFLGFPNLYSGPGGGAGPSAQTALYYGGLSAIPTVFSMGGTPTVGASMTLSIQGTSITYTAPYTMSLREFITQFTRKINESNPLIWQRIAARGDTTSITVWGPYDMALAASVSSVTTVTASAAAGARLNGAWGSLDGLDYPGASTGVPGITVDAYALPLKISNSWFDNVGGTTASGYSIDSRSIGVVDFLNWPSGATNSVTSCGTSPTIAANSTDLRGAVTEGTTSVGCTIAFRAAMPRAPFCTVTPSGGSAVAPTTIVPSTTGLTYTHASTSNYQYTWICKL